MADPTGDFFGVLPFTFFAGFALEDPMGGRQITAYSNCITANGARSTSNVLVGSATKAGNRR